MRHYETMYVLHPELDPERVDGLITKFQRLVIENGGKIEQVQEIGKRRLAYEIQGVREGNYVLMMYQGSTFLAGELERVFKITEGILRHLTVRVW
jgi:small subunit ribosomal protein S6